ncbi:MAG: 1-deoxy-D-xylulose-5-phosphate reductoisomerase [Flavobacteriales bacterium]|nr:1-deoxy-D-xylulose-5-phosphate reductoisomerase [Flavobacteriales bacterium]|tara:strand:- start:1418 stop:2587 length:1170 start_codon:yes stop_codon:yes gene_type:complete
MESQQKRNIAILGSTGSIGCQALEVIEANPDRFTVEVLSAYSSADKLIEQALKFKPNCVVIGDEEQYKKVSEALWKADIKCYAGLEALTQVVEMEEIDMVLTAVVGAVGLEPTLAAIRAGKPIALANKETLVVAGELIMQEAAKRRVPIIPVDSEHSAIFQCLVGEAINPIEKIILTASGGPFRGFSKDQLQKVSLADALKHPNWEMGAKITIDSASMMNKGLEVIEAKWLFQLEPSQIEVIVHPESIVHSIVQFNDGSMKAQMGLPDMKLPIQYAMAYPERLDSNFPRFDFAKYATLNFEKADEDVFLNLKLAFEALEIGGTAPCILNAANEITNRAFREEKISFIEIAEHNQAIMESSKVIQKASLEDYLEIDKQTRRMAKERLKIN